MSILFVIVVIFLIVGSAMLYSISKIKNDNIIESLKQENI
jgi:putative ABC transport system permease protein